MFHELIWPQMQGAGHEAVVNLPRMFRNTAAAVKATRPKGEIFRHKIGTKCLKSLITVCIFNKRLKVITIHCILYGNSQMSKNFMKYSG